MTLIRVYRADLSRLPAEDSVSMLDGAERQRASRISHREARQEFAKTRALLRLVLSQHTGWPAASLAFVDGDCGKPALLRPHRVHFNVSHSGGMALIAVAPAEVGIDIERIGGDIDYAAVAQSVFSPAEIGVIRGATEIGKRDAFFSIWARKEAYLKATGRGFSSNLPLISTASPLGTVEDRSDDCAAGQPWHVFDLPAPAGFKAALVASSRESEIRIVDVEGFAYRSAADRLEASPGSGHGAHAL